MEPTWKEKREAAPKIRGEGYSWREIGKEQDKRLTLEDCRQGSMSQEGRRVKDKEDKEN